MKPEIIILVLGITFSVSLLITLIRMQLRSDKRMERINKDFDLQMQSLKQQIEDSFKTSQHKLDNLELLSSQNNPDYNLWLNKLHTLLQVANETNAIPELVDIELFTWSLMNISETDSTPAMKIALAHLETLVSFSQEDLPKPSEN